MTIHLFRGRLSLPHDEIFGFVTCDGLIFFSSDGTISSMASASDLVASKSEGSLSSQWEDRNKSGNCVSAFEFDSKIPASRSSFATLQIVPRSYLFVRAPNECWFFSSSLRTFFVFRTRAFGPVKTLLQCRYTDFLDACAFVIVEMILPIDIDLLRVDNRTDLRHRLALAGPISLIGSE